MKQLPNACGGWRAVGNAEMASRVQSVARGHDLHGSLPDLMAVMPVPFDTGSCSLCQFSDSMYTAGLALMVHSGCVHQLGVRDSSSKCGSVRHVQAFCLSVRRHAICKEPQCSWAVLQVCTAGLVAGLVTARLICGCIHDNCTFVMTTQVVLT